MSDPQHRVVVTGAAGLVGGVLVRHLDDRFDVSGVDRRRSTGPVPGRPIRRGDLRRPSFARRSLRDATTVVHLAARASLRTPWSDVCRTNIRMTWNVLEAAAAADVRRVVLASSNHVVGGYEREAPYDKILAGERTEPVPHDLQRLTAAATVRPDGPYAVGKIVDEAAGRWFADERGLSVIVLRIGTVRPSDRPEETRHLSTLLTQSDLVDLVTCCIDAPDDLRFGTFYGVSANTWRIWDIDHALTTIGYAPRDDAETWRDSLGDR